MTTANQHFTEEAWLTWLKNDAVYSAELIIQDQIAPLHILNTILDLKDPKERACLLKKLIKSPLMRSYFGEAFWSKIKPIHLALIVGSLLTIDASEKQEDQATNYESACFILGTLSRKNPEKFCHVILWLPHIRNVIGASNHIPEILIEALKLKNLVSILSKKLSALQIASLIYYVLDCLDAKKNKNYSLVEISTWLEVAITLLQKLGNKLTKNVIDTLLKKLKLPETIYIDVSQEKELIAKRDDFLRTIGIPKITKNNNQNYIEVDELLRAYEETKTSLIEQLNPENLQDFTKASEPFVRNLHEFSHKAKELLRQRQDLEIKLRSLKERPTTFTKMCAKVWRDVKQTVVEWFSHKAPVLTAPLPPSVILVFPETAATPTSQVVVTESIFTDPYAADRPIASPPKITTTTTTSIDIPITAPSLARSVHSLFPYHDHQLGTDSLLTSPPGTTCQFALSVPEAILLEPGIEIVAAPLGITP